MAGHEWEGWFEREELIGQISDIRVQNLQVEREVVQKRTFTRWINLHLEKCDPSIEVHDLFRDIQDGHVLMALLEELSGCKLLHGFKKSSHRIFRLNNIAKVLTFLEERNVKLVSIDAADVADGNSSIILGLIWNIILFFQIKELTGNIRSQFPSSSSLSSIPTSSDSDTSNCSSLSDERQLVSVAMREHSKAIKKLLQWVQNRTRKYGVAVRDFGKSWTSGLAFLAVIKSIDPSLIDTRKALLRSARENLEDAFRIAHYSLGIPRLLEPEDVTINAPDEQSIITYVSQFLEHFPGMEKPEEPCQLIEQSVSMARLNFHDHIRNGPQQSRVKERSYMFQGDYAPPPPNMFISSVSEVRSAMSPPFEPATARSWSTKDLLADSPHMEDISSSLVEDAKEPFSEVLSNSTLNSPKLSDTQSPTSYSVHECVNTESILIDSAVGSPDSWMESDFEGMSGRFCENRSDSSLCDSGIVWDVYRADPVEVITLDDDTTDNIAHDEQSQNEKGIYSMISVERPQELILGYSERKQVEVLTETKANLKNHNQKLALEQILDSSKAETTEEVDTKRIETRLETSFGLSDVEVVAKSDSDNLLETVKTNQSYLNSNTELPFSDLVGGCAKQTSVEEKTPKELECLQTNVDSIGDAKDHEEQINGQTEILNDRNNWEEAAVESQCQKTDDLFVEKREGQRDSSWIVKERDERVQDTRDEAWNTVQEILTTETDYASVNTNPTNREGSPSNRQAHARDGEVHPPETTGNNGGDTDVNSAHHEDELSCDSCDNHDKKPVEISSENVKPTSSEQIRDTENCHLDDTDEKDSWKSSNVETCDPCKTDNMEISEAKQECEFPQNSSQTDNPDKDNTGQTSSTDDRSLPVTNDQDKLEDTFSDSETTDTQQSTLNPVNSELHEDEVGVPIEPMDLFYPDKEEPMFTEPSYTEMQSWPCVLSVSALQPAPASETLPDDHPLALLHGNLRIGEDLTHNKVATKIQNTDKASESQELCLLPWEKKGRLWGDDVGADGSDIDEAEPPSPGSVGENTEPVWGHTRPDESPIPPVLRHRKTAGITESVDKRETVTVAARNDDNGDFW
ncbi:putative calmin [Scophthalmus maximus]|uniref:Calmin n=1 Tax=Scophthalmus maximus TaxID=52904 RepID=A0A2U9CK65_SCOMX|nr:putative calmin [Scophthalmus maximus]